MKYVLLREMPGHNPGETLTLYDNHYVWDVGEIYTIPKEKVENHPGWFLPYPYGWKDGEDQIYYLGLDMTIYDDVFQILKHIQLVNYGNAFKNEEQARDMSNKIQKIFKGNFYLIEKEKVDDIMVKIYTIEDRKDLFSYIKQNLTEK